MLMKMFVLGCSGSGKSMFSRYIQMLAHDRNWSAEAISDYRILYQMFLSDVEHEKFRPAAQRGFDVCDMSVYSTALDKLNRQAQGFTKDAKRNELVIIEFARCDYREALKHFDRDFLRDGSFLFLDADIDTCLRRIRGRIAQPHSLDDHFVPDHVVDCFGQASNKQYLESGLKRDYGVADDRVRIIDTRGSIQEVAYDVKQFIDTVVPTEVGRVPLLVGS